MIIKTCVHALLHSKKLYYVTLMDSNLSLQYFSFLGDPPVINDYVSPTNLLTLAGQIVTSINNANLNNIPQLTLASGDIKGDCLGCRESQAIANFDNSSVSNGAPQYEWIISFYVTADYNVSGGGGGSEIDYTSILTSINNNLSALVSKNNQSEITQKLSDIFEYTLSDNSKSSCLKANDANTDQKKIKANLIRYCLQITQLLTNADIDYQNGVIANNSILKEIRKCLKFQVPLDNSNDIYQNLVYIKNYINLISNKLSETVSNVDVPLLKEIAFAISSLASADDNLAIKDLKQAVEQVSTNINNKDNVLVVDGTQTFEFRPKSDES